MSSSANVRSVDAIRDFRAAMATFAEDARVALGSMDMEVRRTRDWLQRDQLVHWQSQVKRCTELVSMARTELHRRRLSQSNSDAISDTEQKENLRAAQRRLDEAEDKVRRIKGLIPVLEHAITEYRSTVQPLGDSLTGSFERSMAVVERAILAIEAYLTTAPPSMPPPAPAGTTTGPQATGPASAGESSSSVGPGDAPEPAGEAVAESTAAEPGPDPEAASGAR